jgi:hypothetical protein
MSCFSLFIFSSCFSCTDSTSVINLFSISSRYFRTFDLAALICFIRSLSQITRPCPIKYKSMKAQHQQVEVDRSQTLTEFITDDEIKLKRGVHYYLTYMAVTSDNKLLFCNYNDDKVHIYC